MFFEVARGPLGEGRCVNPNKYSCYFIIVVMSYAVRNPGVGIRLGAQGGCRITQRLYFTAVNTLKNSWQRIFSCKFTTFTGIQALLKKKKKTTLKICYSKCLASDRILFRYFFRMRGDGEGIERRRRE